ncbi:acetyl-CoA carboxylase biotin carboxyl carrier protein [Metabacillus litoralis]|uniref:acetyl-CoA carboxylase biotin carboxyl carrier protein n=1 Tax=Metabacillus litoralis TaxID=152268 RepID=UPI0020422C89|nr:acetyl-CoA carboxylase biotin carboxyl carrier protein [Metabacillus litoralis]MCM3411576.1 acetyl-CoA carboxylase biotin carboxyl carrier protein [Metabacillus litoralis]
MFNINDIKEMIKAIDSSSIQKFKVEHEGTKVVIEKISETEVKPVIETVSSSPSPAAPAVAEAPFVEKKEKVEEVKEDLHNVLSPMVGTFYSRSNPDADPFVQVGSKVQKETVICIVEAMKLFNEIEAEVNGEIVEILVEEGQLVEFGQPLFAVRKS